MKINKLLGFVNFIILLIYMLWGLVPVVNLYLSKTSVAVILILWYITYIFVKVLNNEKLIIDNLYVYIIIFIFVAYYLLSNYNYAIGNLYVIIIFYFNIIIYNYYSNQSHSVYYKYIVYFYLAIICYNAIININILLEQPSLSKLLTGGDEYIAENYIAFNLASLSYIISVSIVFPILLMSIKKFKIQKKYLLSFIYVIIALLIIIWIILAMSLITTAILIFTLITVIVCNSNNKHNILWFILSIIFIVYVLNTINFSFSDFLNSINLNDYAYRYELLKDVLFSNNNVLNVPRIPTILVSIDSFVNNIFWGVGYNYDKIGFHSQIFDDLARYGLLVMMFILCLYTRFFNKLLLLIDKNFKIYYILLLTTIIFSMILNPFVFVSTGITLFVVIPIFLAFLKNI